MRLRAWVLAVAVSLATACAANELGPARVAANAAATAIDDEAARVQFAIRLDAYHHMALCAPGDTDCKHAAAKAALEAGASEIARVNAAASTQRLLAHELDLAASCKAAHATCYREAADAALEMAAEMLDAGATENGDR